MVVTHNNSTAVDSLTYFCVHCESLSRDSKGPFSCASLWRGLHFAVQTHFSQRSHTRAVCVRLADHSPLRGGPASGGWPKNQVKSPFGVSKPEKFSGLAGADNHRAPGSTIPVIFPLSHTFATALGGQTRNASTALGSPRRWRPSGWPGCRCR